MADHQSSCPIRSVIKRRAENKQQASTRKIAAHVGLSRATVRLVNKQLGLLPRHQPTRPLLSAYQQHSRTFVRKYAKHDWRVTTLSGEKTFDLLPLGNSKNDVVWARNASSVPPRLASPFGWRLVCGGITHYGKPSPSHARPRAAIPPISSVTRVVCVDTCPLAIGQRVVAQ